MKKIILAISTAVLMTTAFSAGASADSVDLSLASPIQTGVSGATVSFIATISAPASNAADVFLNSDSTTVDYPLSLDDSDFFMNFPLSLPPGDSVTNELFTINIPDFANLGVPYNGYFEIDGGPDSNAGDFLASVTFQVIATPEPRSIALLLAGLLAVGVVLPWKRLATAAN